MVGVKAQVTAAAWADLMDGQWDPVLATETADQKEHGSAASRVKRRLARWMPVIALVPRCTCCMWLRTSVGEPLLRWGCSQRGEGEVCSRSAANWCTKTRTYLGKRDRQHSLLAQMTVRLLSVIACLPWRDGTLVVQRKARSMLVTMWSTGHMTRCKTPAGCTFRVWYNHMPLLGSSRSPTSPSRETRNGLGT